MSDKPSCSCGGCGCGSEKGKNIIIFACAGVANTGQLTNLAAVQLTQEGFGSAACVALLANGPEGLLKAVKDSDGVLILDGCNSKCAGKIAADKGIVPCQHVIVTDLGIKKAGSSEYTDDDIEEIVSAVWEGKGMTK
ncbi:putative zinc-binding protein [Methanochimaera problematica]|uniref:putative zinc-binding protein n=1 Tax=Methanochimaera problematica TaxID=2609417 RepID=UPI0029394A65|nr:putative zinc-binding protein [Methanoplanus sp. FWC-SCC4]